MTKEEHNMKRKPLASIVTAGCSIFGKRDGLLTRELFAEAVSEAYGRCPNLDPQKDIQAVFVGHADPRGDRQAHMAAVLADVAGLSPIPSIRTENACASSSVALRVAVMSIMAGFYDVVLVGGVEKMTLATPRQMIDANSEYMDFPMEPWNGIGMVNGFALYAVAYMHKYGATEEDFARVAVKSRKNGVLNPKAGWANEVTLDQVMSSRMISYPIKLLDSAYISDGASCVVITKPELARRFTDNPVDILGLGFCVDTIGMYERADFTTYTAPILAALQAYEMAGVKPQDINVVEVHDCFSFHEVVAYEVLGLCKPGEGVHFFNTGATSPGGKVPVNTSGGLGSKGHPVGATGTGQVYELYLQLTGQAGQRQVPNAEVGLNHNVGSVMVSAAVGIYRRRD